MELRSGGHEVILALLDKGVRMPHPGTVDVGPEVDPDRISGDGVTIHPGCRIRGASTVISAGVSLGAEAPMTVDDCRLGPGVALKGGFASGSTFLAGANLGSAAQVRDGCLLEEEAGGAHSVGLKQTILLPFVTLGSLINFCDVLMAGGTSRKDHGEVGSSYVHFNFTPAQDKATASLFGDVPRGVMLDQPPIFLGGQGGAVGPIRVGFGSVVGAGAVLREDVLDDGQLVMPSIPSRLRRPVAPRSYRRLPRLVANNLHFLANLVALEQWYRQVRREFFDRQPLGPLVYEGALDVLAAARAERLKRLGAMVRQADGDDPARSALRARIDDVLAVFADPELPSGEEFLQAWSRVDRGPDYVTTVQQTPAEVRAVGTAWLGRIVDTLVSNAGRIVPEMPLDAG